MSSVLTFRLHFLLTVMQPITQHRILIVEMSVSAPLGGLKLRCLACWPQSVSWIHQRKNDIIADKYMGRVGEVKKGYDARTSAPRQAKLQQRPVRNLCWWSAPQSCTMEFHNDATTQPREPPAARRAQQEHISPCYVHHYSYEFCWKSRNGDAFYHVTIPGVSASPVYVRILCAGAD